uniref:Uncharacterized protein n=1 Tax=Solanum tuberosum TaxID=4113 RepID=M1CG47_SOLTU
MNRLHPSPWRLFDLVFRWLGAQFYLLSSQPAGNGSKGVGNWNFRFQEGPKERLNMLVVYMGIQYNIQAQYGDMQELKMHKQGPKISSVNGPKKGAQKKFRQQNHELNRPKPLYWVTFRFRTGS